MVHKTAHVKNNNPFVSDTLKKISSLKKYLLDYLLLMTLLVWSSVMIEDVLVWLDLPITSLHGQCEDGATNMSGAYKGAQALIRKHSPLALFVHCEAHCTNLVAQDSCDAPPVVRDILVNSTALGVLLHQSY